VNYITVYYYYITLQFNLNVSDYNFEDRVEIMLHPYLIIINIYKEANRKTKVIIYEADKVLGCYVTK